MIGIRGFSKVKYVDRKLGDGASTTNIVENRSFCNTHMEITTTLGEHSVKQDGKVGHYSEHDLGQHKFLQDVKQLSNNMLCE